MEDEVDLHSASFAIAKCLEREADNSGIIVSEVVRQAVAGGEVDVLAD